MADTDLWLETGPERRSPIPSTGLAHSIAAAGLPRSAPVVRRRPLKAATAPKRGHEMIRDAEMLEMLVSSIARFVDEALIPREHEVADIDAMPADVVDQMKALGLFGLTIPEEFGGLGVTMEEEVRIAFELGRASPAFRSYIGTN